MKFKVVADFIPTGDQPQAIKQLAGGITSGESYQTLLGVTGSGKTSVSYTHLTLPTIYSV